MRGALVWVGVAAAIALPLAIAAMSPLLAWREPIYIAAGFAGILGLALLLLQPLLAVTALPGLSPRRSRALHRMLGVGLLLCVIAHVGGLWITSPPDVVDALLLRSPTPFSLWGVIAMWAVFAAAALAVVRRRLRPRNWQRIHLAFAVVITAGTVAHALLIEGAMGTISKAALCAVVLAAVGWVVVKKVPRRAV
ncbi:MAG: ferric reductase-like transmembrane domain-containing protein [Pseudomonadota bacterium]